MSNLLEFDFTTIFSYPFRSSPSSSSCSSVKLDFRENIGTRVRGGNICRMGYLLLELLLRREREMPWGVVYIFFCFSSNIGLGVLDL
jgi:hypothetical protein